MISEIRLNNGSYNYLVNQGVCGICDGYNSSDKYTLYLKPDLESSTYLKNNTSLEKMIIPVKFPNGLNRTSLTSLFDIKGNNGTITYASNYTSNIYELPEGYNGFVSIDPYAKSINLIEDSLLCTNIVTSGPVGTVSDSHPPTTPVTLNYWPPFLVSYHLVTDTAESVAAWAKYEKTLTCNLNTNYSYDTSKVWYYAISVTGYRSGNRYMQPNSLYLSNSGYPNTCTVFLRFTNMSADSHPVNVNSSVSILWIRQVLDGIA